MADSGNNHQSPPPNRPSLAAAVEAGHLPNGLDPLSEEYIAYLLNNHQDWLADGDFSLFPNEEETTAVAGAGADAGDAAAGEETGGNDGPVEMSEDGSGGSEGGATAAAVPTKKRKASTAMAGARKTRKPKAEKKSNLAVAEKELVAIRPGYTMGTLAIFKAPQTDGDRTRNAKSDHRIIRISATEKVRLRALRRGDEEEEVEEDEDENEE